MKTQKILTALYGQEQHTPAPLTISENRGDGSMNITVNIKL
jgi:hypothetical protein